MCLLGSKKLAKKVKFFTYQVFIDDKHSPFLFVCYASHNFNSRLHEIIKGCVDKEVAMRMNVSVILSVFFNLRLALSSSVVVCE